MSLCWVLGSEIMNTMQNVRRELSRKYIENYVVTTIDGRVRGRVESKIHREQNESGLRWAEEWTISAERSFKMDSKKTEG